MKDPSVVTSCDSGIGLTLASNLAARGTAMFAMRDGGTKGGA